MYAVCNVGRLEFSHLVNENCKRQVVCWIRRKPGLRDIKRIFNLNPGRRHRGRQILAVVRHITVGFHPVETAFSLGPSGVSIFGISKFRTVLNFILKTKTSYFRPNTFCSND